MEFGLAIHRPNKKKDICLSREQTMLGGSPGKTHWVADPRNALWLTSRSIYVHDIPVGILLGGCATCTRRWVAYGGCIILAALLVCEAHPLMLDWMPLGIIDLGDEFKFLLSIRCLHT